MGDLLQAVSEAVINMRLKDIQGLVQEALNNGLEPKTIVNDGLIQAMDAVGRRFADGRIFVPEMMVAAMTMNSGLEVLKPLLSGDEVRSQGTIIMATVKGDLHDIGKNIVTMMLEGAGFEVKDLGVDLNVDKLVEQVEALKPDILGLSALLTTTMPEMSKVIEELEGRGFREKVKVIVGGAPVDEAFARAIGADGYGANAAEAVALARRLIGSAN